MGVGSWSSGRPYQQPDREPPAPTVRPPRCDPGRAELAGPHTDRLLAAAGRGDVQAFVAFYDLTAPAVFGLLTALFGGDTATAAGAAERAYGRLWRHAPRFDPSQRSAYTLLIDQVRREAVVPLTRTLTPNRHVALRSTPVTGPGASRGPWSAHWTTWSPGSSPTGPPCEGPDRA